jgi:hypothetical protein
MDVSAALTALQARRDAIGAWTLGVAAVLSGREEEARTWRGQLAAGTLMADVLDALLAHGDAMLLVLQQRLIQEGRTSLPFARSVVHAALGRRLAATRPAAADSVWRWTEAADLDEFPSGPAQAGEVDWAFAPWAARWRADLPACTGRRC